MAVHLIIYKGKERKGITHPLFFSDSIKKEKHHLGKFVTTADDFLDFSKAAQDSLIEFCYYLCELAIK